MVIGCLCEQLLVLNNNQTKRAGLRTLRRTLFSVCLHFHSTVMRLEIAPVRPRNICLVEGCEVLFGWRSFCLFGRHLIKALEAPSAEVCKPRGNDRPEALWQRQQSELRARLGLLPAEWKHRTDLFTSFSGGENTLLQLDRSKVFSRAF